MNMEQVHQHLSMVTIIFQQSKGYEGEEMSKLSAIMLAKRKSELNKQRRDTLALAYMQNVKKRMKQTIKEVEE